MYRLFFRRATLHRCERDATRVLGDLTCLAIIKRFSFLFARLVQVFRSGYLRLAPFLRSSAARRATARERCPGARP